MIADRRNLSKEAFQEIRPSEPGTYDIPVEPLDETPVSFIFQVRQRQETVKQDSYTASLTLDNTALIQDVR